MELVVIRGGGDLASGVAYKLFMSGFKVVVLEIEKPSSIRRTVCFSEAVYDGEITIEGVKGVLAKDKKHMEEILEDGNIPVCVDRDGSIIKELNPLAVVDAILAKKNLGTRKELAPITIGIGPGFEAGEDVDLVIESQRGHYLGRVIHKGPAIANTGIPGNTMGYTEERVLRAPGKGRVKSFYNIGDRVEKGNIICKVGEENVLGEISGVLRGLIREDYLVDKNFKIGDIDPRGIVDYAFTISDKARSIGGGVLEAILYMKEGLK